jgi:hypothetical protein
MQCRDTKCAPERVIEKERVTYMQTLKRKCSLANKPSKQDVQAYSACALNHYNGSRLKPMDDKQNKCSKKNCDHLIRFGGKKRTRRQRAGDHRDRHSSRSRYSRQSGKDIIHSNKEDMRVSQQGQLVAQQNEFDIAQKQLVKEIAEEMAEKIINSKCEHRYFVIGKYLRWWFYPSLTDNLTEKEIREINTIIPDEGFKEYGRRLDLTLRKFLYYTLIMTVIRSIVRERFGKS